MTVIRRCLPTAIALGLLGIAAYAGPSIRGQEGQDKPDPTLTLKIGDAKVARDGINQQGYDLPVKIGQGIERQEDEDERCRPSPGGDGNI